MWTTIILICTLLILLYRYFKSKYSVFKNLGIDGPPPNLVLGNFLDLQNRKGSDHIVLYNWSKKYGKTFGYYEGGQPILLTSDPDMVQEVLVKQFNNFPGRKVVSRVNPNDAKGVNMFIAEGPRWKRLRILSNPMFTSGKLNELEPTVQSCLSEFLENIDQRFQSAEPFDIYELYQALTLDVIGQTAFGLSSNCQKNLDDPLLLVCQDVFRIDLRKSIVGTIIAIFPEFPYWSSLIKLAPAFRNSPGNKLKDMVAAAVDKLHQEAKQTNSASVRNFINMMLEAELPGDVDLSSLHSFENDTDGQNVLKVEKRMTSDEIVQQMLLFLLAGYETTSTALGYATYLLATNPEVQDKLFAEIDDYFSTVNKKEKVEFSDVKRLKYLDSVFSETLRLYPVAGTVVHRRAKEECIINGVTIPAGLAVQINVWAIHRDPSLWGPDPEEFRPERHFDEPKHPMAWLPFGGGPRFCIGMRFALMEAKLALVTLLRKYKFVKGQKTQVPLKLRTQGTIQPDNGIWISLAKR